MWQSTMSYGPGIGEGSLAPREGVFRLANEMREAYLAMHEDD